MAHNADAKGEADEPQMQKGGATGSLTRSETFDVAKDYKAQALKREPLKFVIVRHYRLPRRIVVKCLEYMDGKESPDRPGLMYETTLREMVKRFDGTFDPNMSEEAANLRQVGVDLVMKHLQRHTRRRRGDGVLHDGFIEWEKTAQVYELFSVELNLLERVFFTVDVGETTSVLSQMCSFFLIFMICVSILMWMLSTLPEVNEIPSRSECYDLKNNNECAPEPAKVFRIFERISVYVFTVEYLLRVLTVHSVRFALLDESFLRSVLTGVTADGSIHRSASLQADHDSRGVFHSNDGSSEYGEASLAKADGTQSSLVLDGGFKTTVKYVFKISNLVDLFAILPFWIEEISGAKKSGGALMVLRVLRLTRIFRVFKLGKYNDVFNLFSRVVLKSSPALSLMLFFISLGCCLFGTLIWFTEQGKWYPEGHLELLQLDITKRGAYLRRDGTMADALQESPFHSIIHSFWYIIATITTVGYGDLAPTTPAGKLVGSLTILNGIVVLAMPIGVVGTNFSSEYYKVLEEKKRRARLSEQLETLAAVEQEQDAALNTDDHEAADSPRKNTSSRVAVEIHRIYGKRNEIISEAEELDSLWQAIMPTIVYQQLSGSFLNFVDFFLCGNMQADSPITARPTISVARLTELDAIGEQVHVAIRAAISLEEEAKFGIQEAHNCRRAWASFAEKCWEYAIELCRVEKLSEPPEFFTMKALLVRSLGTADNGSDGRIPNLPKAESPWESLDGKEDCDDPLSPTSLKRP